MGINRWADRVPTWCLLLVTNSFKISLFLLETMCEICAMVPYGAILNLMVPIFNNATKMPQCVISFKTINFILACMGDITGMAQNGSFYKSGSF